MRKLNIFPWKHFFISRFLQQQTTHSLLRLCERERDAVCNGDGTSDITTATVSDDFPMIHASASAPPPLDYFENCISIDTIGISRCFLVRHLKKPDGFQNPFSSAQQWPLCIRPARAAKGKDAHNELNCNALYWRRYQEVRGTGENV